MIREIEKNIFIIKENIISYNEKRLYEKEVENLLSIINFDKEFLDFLSLNAKIILNKAKKNIIEAKIDVIRIEQIIHNYKNLSEDELKYIQLVLKPLKAYISYKEGDYKKSLDLTNETMVISNFFESKHSVMFFKGIQQLHNVFRIKIKNNEIIESSYIINDLFSILILKNNILYNNIVFSFQNLSNNYSELNKLFVRQVFYEWTNIINIIDEKDRLTFFLISTKSLRENIDQNCEFIDIYYWIDVMNDLLNNDRTNKTDLLISNFLNHSNDYYSLNPISLINSYL